jgi:hypothetical protein
VPTGSHMVGGDVAAHLLVAELDFLRDALQPQT